MLGGINDETSQLLQASVESAYAKFVGVVAQGRKVPAAKIEAIAQGRVWSGEQARQNGLVDEYGDLDAALAYAAKRAGGWRAGGTRSSSNRRNRPGRCCWAISAKGLRARRRGRARLTISPASSPRANASSYRGPGRRFSG
ncbi:S49 family peptidase [Novosphingobium colocasiae]